MLTMNVARMPKRYSTETVASKVGVTRQTLYKWARSSEIHVPRDNQGHYIWCKKTVNELCNYMKEKSKRQRERVQQAAGVDGLKSFAITNRRYLGSKTRLLPFISDVVDNNTHGVHSIADIFAGTGVVASMFRNRGAETTINDILTSNTVVYSCFFGSQPVRYTTIQNWILQMNNLPGQRGYVTANYGSRYFSENNAMKIDAARVFIEQQAYRNSREKNILLTSLVYALDKVANTVGHYDAYRKTMDSFEPICFLMPRLPKRNDAYPSEIFQSDANELVRNLSHKDLIYIDTPYNSRQYGDTYHVPENIVCWQKPKLYGIAKKPLDRSKTRSVYCTAGAGEAFADLIEHIDARYILVSYNNMAHKGNGRSNAKISNEEILNILSKRGKVKIFSTPFRAFTTGKTRLDDHKELLYLVNTGE